MQFSKLLPSFLKYFPIRDSVNWNPAIQNNILEVLIDGFASPILQSEDINKITK